MELWGRPFIMYAPGRGGQDPIPVRISYLCNVKKVRTWGGGGQIWPKKAYILNGRPLYARSFQCCHLYTMNEKDYTSH